MSDLNATSAVLVGGLVATLAAGAGAYITASLTHRWNVKELDDAAERTKKALLPSLAEHIRREAESADTASREVCEFEERVAALLKVVQAGAKFWNMSGHKLRLPTCSPYSYTYDLNTKDDWVRLVQGTKQTGGWHLLEIPWAQFLAPIAHRISPSLFVGSAKCETAIAQVNAAFRDVGNAHAIYWNAVNGVYAEAEVVNDLFHEGSDGQKVATLVNTADFLLSRLDTYRQAISVCLVQIETTSKALQSSM